MDDDQRLDRILSEQLMTRLDTIQELVQDVPEIKERLGRVENRLDKVEIELVVHREILREHSGDLSEIKLILGTQMEAITEVKLLAHSH